MDSRVVNTHQDYCRQVRLDPDDAPGLFGMDWDMLVRRVDQHTQTVQQWLSSRAPNAARYAGTGIIATSTGLNAAILNMAHTPHFLPDTPEAIIDGEIEAVKAFFTTRQVPYSWWVSPLASPPDTDERLQRHGLERNIYNLPAMAAPLNAAYPALKPGVNVWQARDRDDLAHASTIRRTAFNFPGGGALTYFEDMAADWLRGDPARLYLATDTEDTPLGIGALITGAGLPGVYVMATLPEAQGRGIGRAILARMLDTARAEGHTLIALTAGARAYSLYRKFGFAHLYEYGIYSPR